MTQNKGQQGSSEEQARQAARNAAGKGKAPETEGFDKKLDGPNRPST
ncbi:hypothetical protein [Paenibacillus sp. sgz302251]